MCEIAVLFAVLLRPADVGSVQLRCCCWSQDMCVVLELRDPTLLVPSLKKVAAVAAAIPSVETFVAQVRGVTNF